MNYSTIIPISTRVPADRQGAKRHYGVHPYFTRRPYNVIAKYISHYTDQSDRVLDPFGGSGVTAIEAFLQNRTGIHNDINPLANFIVEGIYELRNIRGDELYSAMSSMESRCKKRIEEATKHPRASLEDFGPLENLPPNILLPATSDVEHYYDLFSPLQMAVLAILKNEIDRIKEKPIKHAFLLAWSATLAKLNKTFISAKGRAESRGGSSIFSIYRYKVAKQPVALDPWATFRERFMNITKAQKEIAKIISFQKTTRDWRGELQILEKDVEDLVPVLGDSMDYIITDPPYGGNISYLDLSLLWNNWLGRLPKDSVRSKEIIVGGDLKLTEEYYVKRLYDSIVSCFTMLKDDRWLSVIFQHWNINYFEAILSAADESGAELKTAISQIGDPIWSMHKKKGNQSVMAGEFILTFHKKGSAAARRKKRKKIDLSSLIDEILENNREDYIYGEYLVNMAVIRAWECDAIDTIKIDKDSLAELLNEKGWYYNSKNHYWSKNSEPRQSQQNFDFKEETPLDADRRNH